jgi:diaminopropionate ammonia-lyase
MGDRDPTSFRWFVRPDARRWTCPAAPSSVAAFHAGLPGYQPTPLIELAALAPKLGVRRVFVKDESARLGLPAFKILGASWAVARVIAARTCLPEPWSIGRLREASTDSSIGLVTATDGNHGRAVARMAALLDVRARVFVAEAVPPAAIAFIESEGARVERVPGSYDDAVAAAARFAEHNEATELVQDTAWPGYETVPGWIVEGYSTLLRELDAQLARAGETTADLIVVPVGVGSLAQAVVQHMRSSPQGKHTAVLSAEPDTAACVLASMRAGALRSVSTAATVMAGLNCGTPSALAWPVLQAGLDAAVAVTDRQAEHAAAELHALGVSSGPSGAAALAGARVALAGRDHSRRRADLGVTGASVVALLSTEGRDSGSST